MNWIKGLRCFTDLLKATGEIPKCSTSCYSMANKHQIGVRGLEEIKFFQQTVSNHGYIDLSKRLTSARNMFLRFNSLNCSEGNSPGPKRYAMTLRRYGQTSHNGTELMNRDFLLQLWVADRKMKRSRGKRKRKTVKHANGGTVFNQAFQLMRNLFSEEAVTHEKSYHQVKQPPPSQFVELASPEEVMQPPPSQFIELASPEEVKVAPLLARSNLLITRDIEWVNLMLGFEQENRYAVVDVCYPHTPVGFIKEQSTFIARQFLRLRRPFVASITDGLGNELFRVRRPFWWLTSSIYADIDGKEIGVVHRRWHLWKRVYDLYLGNKQFAVVENPGFWNWTFTLKDIDGEVLAQIDRDWRGFGFEIFTDAGQYVIRFGSADRDSNTVPASVIEELEVIRQLTLSERAVAVALAVSLDNDYFSRHGGWGIPYISVSE